MEDIVDAILLVPRKGLQVARGAKGLFQLPQHEENRGRDPACALRNRALKTEVWCRQSISPCHRSWRKSRRRSIFTYYRGSREGCSRGRGQCQSLVGVQVEPKLHVVSSFQCVRESQVISLVTSSP